VNVRVSHISRKTREIWGTLWSVSRRNPQQPTAAKSRFVLTAVSLEEPTPRLVPYGFLAAFRLVSPRVLVFSFDWILWAFTIAAIKPGKRLSISAQREVFCISTP
jgi:hypothetical protein